MSVFTESISSWVHNISINSVIMMIMMIFMLVGAIDKIMGNKKGYGEKFEEGFNAIGPLAISMAGVVAAAPVLATILGPVIKPIYNFFGADSSMFATTLLACDMGGYPLAMELAGDNVAIGNFAGLILGTMMGPTIVFTIPVALGIISKDDRSYLGAGVLAGLITVPIGCIVGGLAMSTMTEYKLGIGTILQNLIPVIIIAALIVIGLWFAPAKMINGFNVFGTGVTIVITAFTAIAVFEQITGIMFPLFDVMAIKDEVTGLSPLDSGLLTCGQIGIVLIGAFPMVEWITRTFGGVLKKLGLSEYYGKHPSSCEELSVDTVFIPFSQHIGKPAAAVKQAGDTVAKGELLAAAAEGALSANIHSSVNGVIEEITDKGARIRCRKE